MPARQLVLGIDGGGTKTECWLAAYSPTTDGREFEFELLGKGLAGPSNPRALGVESATAALDEAIAAAFRDATCQRTGVDSCIIGLAGAGREDIRHAVTDWAAKSRLAAVIEVVPDYELPLAAAAPEGVGIALISGTGSVAFGRNSLGETARGGGWGYLLGDAGSAYAIGRAGIEAACRASDGGHTPTSLTEAIPRHFGARSVRHVADRIYESPDPRAEIASVAPVVFTESEHGDVPCSAVIDAACDALAELVVVLAGRLKLDRGAFPLALAGSVLVNNRPLADDVVAAIANRLDGAPQPVVVPDPVVGVVRMALARLRRV